ncbi:MAG: transcription termination factor NusA [Acutalibacteraceae bacterium]
MSNKLYKDLNRIAEKNNANIDVVLEWALTKVKSVALPGERTDNLFCALNTDSNEAFIYRKMDIVDEVTNPTSQITEEQAKEASAKIDGNIAEVEYDPKRIAKIISLIDKSSIAAELKNREFFAAVELLAKDKDIPIEFIFDQIKESVIKAGKRQDAEARKQAEAKKRAKRRKMLAEKANAAIEAGGDPDEVYEAIERENNTVEEEKEEESVCCDINTEFRTVRIYRKMHVVEEVYNPSCEMTVEQASKYGNAVLGGYVEIDLDPKTLGRLFAMNVKGIIRQGISEEEKRKYKKDVLEKDKEVVRATVVDVNPETGDARISIGKNSSLTLFKADQIPGEKLEVGQEIKVFVSVTKSEGESEASFANISRKEPGLVRRLFEMEVTEISDGTVEIVSTAREPGSRTKIAVSSNDENVDPVGACIGPRGQRVNVVIDALCGEKIDIIRYSENPEEYISAALAPAKVTSVEIDSESSASKKMCHVTVPADQLSLAIGNKGQNVRLAAKLTGWKIDIKADDAE